MPAQHFRSAARREDRAGSPRRRDARVLDDCSLRTLHDVAEARATHRAYGLLRDGSHARNESDRTFDKPAEDRKKSGVAAVHARTVEISLPVVAHYSSPCPFAARLAAICRLISSCLGVRGRVTAFVVSGPMSMSSFSC